MLSGMTNRTTSWYAIRSKPKRESLVLMLLNRSGIEVYLPEVKVHKRQGKPATAAPFFPSYLFARLDASNADFAVVKYTPGVVQIVGYGDEPSPVPEDLITSIRERLTHVDISGFCRGESVVVTSGPFQGLEAIFDRVLSPTGRVQVLLQFLHGVCRAEMHANQLRQVKHVPAITLA
jgi:transcriptional antiterminator RfaH